ncbi:MAG: hypothetical protein ABI134_25055, partial [Byssovorax sp.]
MTRFAHVSFVSFALVFASACSSSSTESPAAGLVVGVEAEAAVNADLGAEALVEEHDEGKVAWRVDSDGQVKAAVSASTGARIKQDLGGTLVYKLESGEPRTVPLVVDAKTGLLVAAGPKLEADLTEINYTITVSGKPWSGVMHVPVGGTAALVASAKVTAEAKLPDETVGPHGGTIQIVGDDRLEMVADADTGETRVFVLDVNLQPVTLETRTLRMGFVSARSELVTFAPAPTGLFFVGRIGAAVDPLRITVALGLGGVVRSAIWGYRPGIRIYAPSATILIATAPRIRFRLTGGFDSDVDVYGRAHVNVKGNNGRHVGQDGTWARDSGGFKSNNDSRDLHGGGNGNVKIADHGGGDHGGHDAKRSPGNEGGGAPKSGGGGSVKISSSGG